jgi:hypothetical protein
MSWTHRVHRWVVPATPIGYTLFIVPALYLRWGRGGDLRARK